MTHIRIEVDHPEKYPELVWDGQTEGLPGEVVWLDPDGYFVHYQYGRFDHISNIGSTLATTQEDPTP
jgi:hypothetical protein